MVEFVVEVGKKGKFTSRSKQRIFKTKSQAVKFAKKKIKEGEGVAIDRLTSRGQQPLAIVGKKNSQLNFSNIKGLGKKPRAIKRRSKEMFDLSLGL